MPPLLQVHDLQTYFETERGVVRAVDGVSYHVEQGEIVGLVGESGCGKSVSLLSVMRLLPTPPARIVGGRVEFAGRDLLQLAAHGPEMRSIRGGQIGMVFQEPMTSLNPVLTISRQLSETLELHLAMDGRSARARAVELLEAVGIPDATDRTDHYPHQFSGGMRQRIMVAMAMACGPRVLLADEPTTALDVTTQAQLLQLMRRMVAQSQAALLIVTHNLGIVARYAQRIYVMYAGRIVESGTAKEVFGRPSHPYTIGLLNAVPRLDVPRGRRLVPIEGAPPSLVNMRAVCAFLPRCGRRGEQCRDAPWPELRHLGGQHYVGCCAEVGTELDQ
jgi:peptide/nickel transport system ATP-binding protein